MGQVAGLGSNLSWVGVGVCSVLGMGWVEAGVWVVVGMGGNIGDCDLVMSVLVIGGLLVLVAVGAGCCRSWGSCCRS
jgi:hypothetical protein